MLCFFLFRYQSENCMTTVVYRSFPPIYCICITCIMSRHMYCHSFLLLLSVYRHSSHHQPQSSQENQTPPTDDVYELSRVRVKNYYVSVLLRFSITFLLLIICTIAIFEFTNSCHNTIVI
jgi:hypothetical protein